MVKGQGVLGPREHYSLDFLLENCLVFPNCFCYTLLPTPTSTPVQVGNNFQLGAKPRLSPTMSYHYVCLQSVSSPTCTHLVLKESIQYKGKLTTELFSKNPKCLSVLKFFKWVTNQNGRRSQNPKCCYLQLICNETRRVNSRHWYKKSTIIKSLN